MHVISKATVTMGGLAVMYVIVVVTNWVAEAGVKKPGSSNE